MRIDHEEQRERLREASEKMKHPMVYHDGGAPKQDYVIPMSASKKREWENTVKRGKDISEGRETPPYLRKGK